MNELDQAHNNLNTLIKAKLKINPGLESVERRSEYGAMINTFHRGFEKQIADFLKSDVWKQLDERFHAHATKADPNPPYRLWTDADFKGVQVIVDDNLDPLADVQPTESNDHNMTDMFGDFLILVFNLGGQDFLNKHNIPKTFNLTNENISDSVKSQASASFSGLDETTSQWIVDQIATGRQNGMSDSDIADSIRDQVPQTYINRAERIVRTETARMVGQSEHVTATKNGASHKEWVTVGDGGVCDLCEGNEAVGTIGIDQRFPSGDSLEPAHPNCRCLVEYLFTPFMSSIWSGN
jgi:SPP1 gp7 family putative phage head morphogenesis protein